MLVYEVTATVPLSDEIRYRAWLRRHIAEIFALPGFTGVKTWQVQDAPAGCFRSCCQYSLSSPEALQNYLRDHAPRLREEAMSLFGASLSAERRVMHDLSL
ncbi:MAG: hypothetical protein RL095_1280 [Verrucomicrobiota bacterium]|jgi:hypothetical protein